MNDKNDFWIGGTDIAVEGEWTWSYSGQRFGFTDWNPGEPSNYGAFKMTEECAELKHSLSYHWNDENCSVKKNNFICEME
ncbi:hypothetical protein KUTeg_015609 [Tegillarca granosa]|uniref:C-type lectin domain-containing protein n=1 Tax=Tegillarca granosa TaxID=220873 RepID=A0ABQ9EV13_TEGGR|nr:hypothetical protein KUTeg_015609 [Tegillarca granosa]